MHLAIKKSGAAQTAALDFFAGMAVRAVARTTGSFSGADSTQIHSSRPALTHPPVRAGINPAPTANARHDPILHIRLFCRKIAERGLSPARTICGGLMRRLNCAR